MEYNDSRYHDTQTTFHRPLQPLPPTLTNRHIILTHLIWLVSPSMLPRHGLTQHCIIASHHTRDSSASPHGRTIDSHFLNLPPDTRITIHSGFHLLQLSNNPYTNIVQLIPSPSPSSLALTETTRIPQHPVFSARSALISALALSQPHLDFFQLSLHI
jgi:hypothetical protein